MSSKLGRRLLLLFLTFLYLIFTIQTFSGRFFANKFLNLVEEKSNLKTELKTARISIFPPGLKAKNLTVHQGEDNDSFSANSAVLKIDLKELFSRHLKIKEIKISGVNIISQSKESTLFNTIKFFTKKPKQKEKKGNRLKVTIDKILIESLNSYEENPPVTLNFQKQSIYLNSAAFEMNRIGSSKKYSTNIRSDYFLYKDKKASTFIADKVNLNLRFFPGGMEFLPASKASFKNSAELSLSGEIKSKLPGLYNLNLESDIKEDYFREITFSNNKKPEKFLTEVGFGLKFKGKLTGEFKNPELSGEINGKLKKSLPFLSNPDCSPKNITANYVSKDNQVFLTNINIEKLGNNSSFTYKPKEIKENSFLLQSKIDLDKESKFLKACFNEFNFENKKNLPSFKLSLEGNPKKNFYIGSISKEKKFKSEEKLDLDFSIKNNNLKSEFYSKPSKNNSFLKLNSNINLKKHLLSIDKLEAVNYSPTYLRDELSIFLKEGQKKQISKIFHKKSILNTNITTSEKASYKNLIDPLLSLSGNLEISNLFDENQKNSLNCSFSKDSLHKKNCSFKNSNTNSNLNFDFSKSSKKNLSFQSIFQLENTKDSSNVLAKINFDGLKSDLASGAAYISITELSLSGKGIEKKLLPLNLEYKNGKINLEKLNLSSSSEYLNIQGSLDKKSGWEATSAIKVNLSNLLYYFKELEQLSGLAEGNIQVKGELNKPQITGYLDISDGLISIPLSKSLIGADNLRGKLIFENNLKKNNLITIKNIYAKAGRGDIRAKGEISNYLIPYLREANATIKLREIDLEPAPNISINLSGDLNLTREAKKHTLIKGKIDLQEAYYENEIDFFKLILKAQKGILGDEVRKPIKIKGSSDKSELINLDIDFENKNQLVIKTDVASAQLNGKLKLTGNNKDPRLNGKLEVTKGDFGLQSGQFKIISGIINFNKNNKINNPELSFSLETEVQSLSGENILIRVNISGSSQNPQVSFSSDSGLSEEELVSLIGVKGNSLTIFKRSGREIALSEILNPGSGASFSERLAGLTGFSKIGIDSTFSDTTGELVPLVTAEKKFSRESNIHLESELTGEFNSRIFADYPLDDNFSLSAGWRSRAATDDFGNYQGSFGVDFIYKKRLPGFIFKEKGMREDSREIE